MAPTAALLLPVAVTVGTRGAEVLAVLAAALAAALAAEATFALIRRRSFGWHPLRRR